MENFEECGRTWRNSEEFVVHFHAYYIFRSSLEPLQKFKFSSASSEPLQINLRYQNGSLSRASSRSYSRRSSDFIPLNQI